MQGVVKSYDPTTGGGTVIHDASLAEYELARYLRLRASGTDASGSRQRNSLFRRVERFGVDVIFFFSF